MTKGSSMKATATVELVILKPQEGASARTRNRIAENGPDFFQMDEQILLHSGSALDGRKCVLVRSASHARDWHGWLPLDEIHFVTML
jgi:hypothetical protein